MKLKELKSQYQTTCNRILNVVSCIQTLEGGFYRFKRSEKYQTKQIRKESNQDSHSLLVRMLTTPFVFEDRTSNVWTFLKKLKIEISYDPAIQC